MPESLTTLSTLNFQEDFQQLQSSIELVLDKKGNIIAANDVAEEIGIFAGSFFHTVPASFVHETYRFISQIKSMKGIIGCYLIHEVQGNEWHVHYRGKEKDKYILLSGYLHECPYTKEIREAISQFEHPSVLINDQLEIIYSSPSFEQHYLEKRATKDILLHKVFQGESFANIPSLVREVFRKKRTLEINITNENSDHYLVKGIFLRNNNLILLMIYDFSYEKKYANLLAYQDQMKSVSYLSAGVAHELRNPLSVIKGFLQLSMLTDSFDKYAQTILSETDRMNEIIDNFLSVARKKMKKEIMTPKYLLNSVIDIIRSECLMQGVHFQSRVEPITGQLEVNESSFKQIILNALRNSIEAFPEGRRRNIFSLQSYQEGDTIVIELSDNGSGIPEDVLEEIEKPFYTTKEKGTGIGIPLCKKIMDDHDGTFQIDSTVGKGTTITLRFPLFEEESK